MSKFKVPANRPTGEVPAPPASPEAFASDAAMAKSQAGGRGLKPYRINFDIAPDLHKALKIRAMDLGTSVADHVRSLIEKDLGRR